MNEEKPMPSAGDATTVPPSGNETPAEAPETRALTPEAKRALAEAEERRRLAQNETHGADATQREVGGRKGPEPTRYGDWEKGGIVSDF